MHFIKLSPTQIVQFNNDLELVCTHNFTPQTSKMSGETPAKYEIEQNNDSRSDWVYEGEAALSMYEYFFNYQSEVRNVMSVEELRLDPKLTRKLEQQRKIEQINMDAADNDIIKARQRVNAEREEILQEQAAALYSNKKLVVS